MKVLIIEDEKALESIFAYLQTEHLPVKRRSILNQPGKRSAFNEYACIIRHKPSRWRRIGTAQGPRKI
jgi:hypothetical protein